MDKTNLINPTILNNIMQKFKKFGNFKHFTSFNDVAIKQVCKLQEIPKSWPSKVRSFSGRKIQHLTEGYVSTIKKGRG